MDKRMMLAAAAAARQPQYVNNEEDEEESSDGESTSEGEEEDLKEEESEYESEGESDESTDASKHKTAVVPNGKPQLAPAKKMPASGSPMKRGRETSGSGKEKEEEPASKKKKKKPELLPVEKVTTPSSKPASTKLSLQAGSKEEKGQPQQGKVKESVANPDKSSRAAALPSKTEKEKEQKPAAVEKENKKPQKKKGLSQVKGDAQKPVNSVKAEGEKEKDNNNTTTPQKPKKPPQPWTLEEELQLSNLLLRETNKGIAVPSSKQHSYWEQRIKEELPFMEKYDKEAQMVRMHEKVRRMRERYDVLAKRIEFGETKNVWKNNKEESLYRIWRGIWGPPDEEDAEGEDDDEDDDKSDEEEEVETEPEPPALKGNLVVALGSEPEAASKQKEENKEKQNDEDDTQEAEEIEVNLPGSGAQAERDDGSESTSEEEPDDEEEEEETSPVPESQPTLTQEAGPPESSLQVELLHQEGEEVMGGADDTAMLDYASSKEAGKYRQVEGGSSKQVQFEGLALLEVVRSSCLMMINEARAQSNLMLEEARAKTLQMVDVARAKSVEIMEDLQAVGKKLRMVACMGRQIGGQQYMPGGGGGVWGGVLDNMGCPPLNDNGFVTDEGAASSEEDSLQQQWHEQHTAEQGLVLQRLQLVQEQARIQQEGIRLQSQSLELRKKQSSQSKL